MKTDKLLQELVNKYMPARYYGHEARRNAKRIAEEYAKLQIEAKKLTDEILKTN